MSTEPKYVSGEVNLIPIANLKMSCVGNWGDNTIAGLIDKKIGKNGACTSEGSNRFIQLEYDDVYLFTEMKFMGGNVGDSWQRAMLEDVEIQYKVNESDEWTLLRTIDGKEIIPQPAIMSIPFEKPVKAKYWRFFKNRYSRIFFGMLRLFGYAPYVPINANSGLANPPIKEKKPKVGADTKVNSIPSQSTEDKKGAVKSQGSSSVTPSSKQSKKTTSKPNSKVDKNSSTTNQEKPIAEQVKPSSSSSTTSSSTSTTTIVQKTGEVNVLVPDIFKVNGDLLMVPEDTANRADNTLEGLLDESAQYGALSTGGVMIFEYKQAQQFKYLEYFTHALYTDSDQVAFCNNIEVFYKVTEHGKWNSFGIIKGTKAYPHLNRFSLESTEGVIEVSGWKFLSKKPILFGTLRMYGYGPFVAAKTKSGSLIPLGSQLESDRPTDFGELAKYYEDHIKENYKPVDEGKTALQQVNNDPSLIVNYPDEGSSVVGFYLHPSFTSLDPTIRSSIYEIKQSVGSTQFKIQNLAFGNSSSQAITLEKFKVEYLNSKEEWIAMEDTQVGYWEPDLVARRVAPFSEEVVFEKSDYYGKYIWGLTLSLKPGEVSSYYHINSLIRTNSEDPCPTSARAMIRPPDSLPYPLTIRISYQDTNGGTKSLKAIYVTTDLVVKTREEFQTNQNLNLSTDFFDECSDTLNKEQYFAGIKLKEGQLTTFISGRGKSLSAENSYELSELIFDYESQKKERVPMKVLETDYCKVEFYLLCDAKFNFKSFAIQMKATTKTCTVERVYPISNIVRNMRKTKFVK